MLRDILRFGRGVRTMRAKHALSEEQVGGFRRDFEAPGCPRREVNRFLDEFLTARIGTDILSSQYLAITKSRVQCRCKSCLAFSQLRLRPDSPTSVVTPDCDPVRDSAKNTPLRVTLVSSPAEG